MPLTDPNLWKVIEAWPLPFREERDDQDPPGRVCRRFEHNLRRIGDWTDEAAKAITAAYRRFLYLKAVSGQPLTPPMWIDQAWHFHLEFRENYAALEAAIHRPIPHLPGLSKPDRNAAFDRGRRLWIAEFDSVPDETTWPSLQRLRRQAIGGYVILCGFALWCLGCILFLPFLWGEVPQSFAVIGIGFLVFLGGAVYGGNVGPPRVSRCG